MKELLKWTFAGGILVSVKGPINLTSWSKKLFVKFDESFMQGNLRPKSVLVDWGTA